MAQAPWTPEHVVDAEAARRMIAAQGWGLALASVEPFGRGFDNTAYLVDGTWVFRFPRRTLAGPLLLTEAAVLPAIAPRLPLAVPRPCLIGQPMDGFPWAFTGYELLPGRTASSAELSHSQRIAVARPVAEFLAALHALPVDDSAAPGTGDNPWRNCDVAAQANGVREEFARLRALGVVDEAGTEACERVIADAAASSLQSPRVLVHGDLYSQHVLVDETGRPTAVIDWGDTHVGHRALDVAFAWIFLPPAGREAFVRAYGEVDAATWRVARFVALRHAMIDVRYGLAEDEPEAVREGRQTLASVLA